MVPITFADIGEEVMIRKITGKDEIRLHLAEMGFVVGEPVTLLAKNGENVIIKVKESRIAIGAGLANRIQIEGN